MWAKVASFDTLLSCLNFACHNWHCLWKYLLSTLESLLSMANPKRSGSLESLVSHHRDQIVNFEWGTMIWPTPIAKKPHLCILNELDSIRPVRTRMMQRYITLRGKWTDYIDASITLNKNRIAIDSSRGSRIIFLPFQSIKPKFWLIDNDEFRIFT